MWGRHGPGCSSFTFRGKKLLLGHPGRNRGIWFLHSLMKRRKSQSRSTPCSGFVRRAPAPSPTLRPSPRLHCGFFFFFLAQTGKCPPCWKAIVVPCQGLNARSPVYCRRTSPGTGGLLAGKVLAQPFSPWSAVTKESAQASGATTMNIKYVRKCRMAVHFWWIQTPLDVPAGLERRFYLKLPCGFTARGRLESTSARSAYGAALTLTPPLLTWALGRTRLCSSRWFFNYRAQKRALDLFAGSKGSVGHYPITWEGSK